MFRFVATLVGDDGTRRALDPAQARRAAGDLYALAKHPGWLAWGVVAINLIVLWVLARDLFMRRR